MDPYREQSHRDHTYSGVVCGLCQRPPQKPFGILGWVFDLNLISCLECRKKDIQIQISN